MKSLRTLALILLACFAAAVPTGRAAANKLSADVSPRIVCPGLKLTARPEDPSGPGIDDYRFPELGARRPENRSGEERPPEAVGADRRNTPLRCQARPLRQLCGQDGPLPVARRARIPVLGRGRVRCRIIPAFYKEQAEILLLRRAGRDERGGRLVPGAGLDYAALVSDFIFVGRELSIGGPESKTPDDDNSWNKSTVEVVPADFTALRCGRGRKCRLSIVAWFTYRTIIAVPARSADLLYHAKRPAMIVRVGHDVLTHLSVDQEPKVVEALRHGNQCIEYERSEDGRKTRFREVIFPGMDAQAIELLDAENDGAVSLFYRTLMHRRKTARPPVIAAIEKEMCRMKPLPEDSHLPDFAASTNWSTSWATCSGGWRQRPGEADRGLSRRIEPGLPEPPKSK